MEKSAGPRKVLRAPALRRGREIIPITDRVKLERVLGFTVSCNASFDCDPHSGIVAYPAGCVVVLYNVRKNKQCHILSSSKKTITSLAFSGDGKYLATGECGHQPHVRVWDVQEKCQIAEFQGHKYGINCVAFSPNLKYVVSVGSQHDMIVNVWDWKNNVKVASNKVSCKVKAISFASNGSYFVTVGNRHVKFWYLECSRSSKQHKLEAVPLMGRSAILGDQRNNYFCDVACGKGEMSESTYAITKSGLLCEFNSRRLLDKWVELRTTSANSISVAKQYVFIGCASGIIRCFSPFDLNFICTLPRPHHLGVDVVAGVSNNKHPTNVKYPDTIAIALDEINKKVTCMYNDHSLYVWDIKEMKKIGKSHSFLYHSACIWGIETYPELPEGLDSYLPKSTFLTCSSDDTIRFWNLESNLAQDTIYHRNIYSSELLKILYIDPELSYLCDVDFNPSGSNDKVDTTYDGKNGVRCLRISQNGKHLASGDRSGNIRIYDLEFLEEVCKVEAHDSEVLCLEYSKPVIINGEEHKYLASASRDRLIHVFDVKQDYIFQKTLDDHSSSITAVRFVQSEQLQMISCGADKSIIFRKAQFNPNLSLVREHHVVGKTTLYDMEVDMHQHLILTACQDRNIRVYSVVNGKQVRSFRGSQGEDGTLIKVVLDPSGTYLATSCTDKSLYIYDYYSGECLATMFGHSELVTGLKFTDNGRHLISVSGDGCIFVWQLPIEVTQNMLSKQCSTVDNNHQSNSWPVGRNVTVGNPVQPLENDVDKSVIVNKNNLVNGNGAMNNENQPPGYRFSVGQLPLWAKKQMLDEIPSTGSRKLAPPVPPRGRWAQRIESQGLVVRSYLDADSIIPYPNVPDESEGKDKTENEQKSLIEMKPVKMSNEEIPFETSEESYSEIMSHTVEEETSGSVTLRKTENFGIFNGKKVAKARPLKMPNISAMRMEDMDAEDERSDSEISEMVFYPVSEDGSDVGDSSFHVCAGNDDGNFKNGTKCPKAPRSENLFADVPSISTPEHIEINSDDEEVSTPVDSDRSFLSSLCVSTENLERLGQREKFMRSNYESLEKDQNVELRDHDSDDKSLFRQSISAKYLANSLAASDRVISNGVLKPSSVAAEKQLSTPTSKREELNKALSEAKKKLETVGFRSGLSSSKSIGDLHNLKDKESFRRPSGKMDSDIRRATSMTDLALSSSASRRRLFSTPVNSKSDIDSVPSAPLWDQSHISSYGNSSRNTQSKPLGSSLHMTPSDRQEEENGEKAAALMSRSISMSSLHAKSRSLTPSLHKAPSNYSLRGSSPFHKNLESDSSVFLTNINSPLRRNNLPSLPPRSQPLNIITTSKLATDSSSDSSPSEAMPNSFEARSVPSRSSCFSPGGFNDSLLQQQFSKQEFARSKLKSRSEWDLKCSGRTSHSKNEWSSGPRHVNNLGYNNSKEFSRSQSQLVEPNSLMLLASDPETEPLTQELCENVSETLKRVASYATQVFQRVTLSRDLKSEDKYQLSNIVAQGIWQAQQTLRMASMPMWNAPSQLPMDSLMLNPRRLPGLNTLPNGDFSDIPTHPSILFATDSQSLPQQNMQTIAFLQQFSDKIVSLVEEKFNRNNEDKQ